MLFQSHIVDPGPAGTAVTRYAGSITEMLPRFGVIAIAVAVVLIALLIYNKTRK
jgi:hypothetical protein